MKLLKGTDLASFVKQRQGREAARLYHQLKRAPKLAIIRCNDDPVSALFVELKQAYGEDMGVHVDTYHLKQTEAKSLISQLNSDDSVDGIIVQLPLSHPSQTDEIVNLIESTKDIDGLGKNASYDPATPTAIMWLLSGYNIDLKGKNVLVIGRGRLVGAPLSKMLDQSNITHQVVDETEKDLKGKTLEADIIVSAVGRHGLLTPEMVKPNAVIVDVGASSVDGEVKGDLAPDVYSRDDLTLTPPRGGVGPLTISALFENVLKAARAATINQ